MNSWWWLNMVAIFYVIFNILTFANVILPIDRPSPQVWRDTLVAAVCSQYLVWNKSSAYSLHTRKRGRFLKMSHDQNTLPDDRKKLMRCYYMNIDSRGRCNQRKQLAHKLCHNVGGRSKKEKTKAFKCLNYESATYYNDNQRVLCIYRIVICRRINYEQLLLEKTF